MKKLVAMLLVFLASRASAQTQPESFYGGNWLIAPATKTAVIASGTTLVPKIYSIYGGLPNQTIPNTTYAIIVDGVRLNVPLVAFNSVFVEGKNITIEQTGSPGAASGLWRVIKQPNPEAEANRWQAYSEVGSDQLIAALNTEQEFVLDAASPGCTGVTFNLLVDGAPIKDGKGNSMAFIPGSTFLGKGKVVAIRVIGTCQTGAYLFGKFKLLK